MAKQNAGAKTRVSNDTDGKDRADDGELKAQPAVLIEPDGTGSSDADAADRFHQPTALFDRGEFLGPLAEVSAAEDAPSTRHQEDALDAPKGIKLIVVAGPDLGLTWAFKKGEITIGRAQECDVSLPDIAVSRTHARIQVEGAKFMLIDSGSENGIVLNGLRVRKERLFSGDEIIVGARTLRFVELTEAPATSAAHPAGFGSEPSGPLGAASLSLVKGVATKGRASEVKVEVAGPMDGPKSVGTLDLNKGGEKKPKASFVKLMIVVMALVGVAGGLAWGGHRFWLYATGRTPEQIEIRTKTAWRTGVALFRQRRFVDAETFFEQVRSLVPDHLRVATYLERCRTETDVWKELEAIKADMADGEWDQAVDALVKLPEETAWRPEIDRALVEGHAVLAERTVKEAEAAIEAGALDLAKKRIDEALTESPNLVSALRLQARLLEMGKKKPEPKPVRPPPKDVLPPELERAAALYAADQITAAIDAAEAAGGSTAARTMQKMREVQSLLSEIATAHRQKAARDLVRLAPVAMRLDQQLAQGRGEVHEKLVEYYADGLYLMGLEAHQDGELRQAFDYWTKAKRVRPGHKLSDSRLLDLAQLAKRNYEKAYALRDSAPDETAKAFQEILAITPSDNATHQLAKKWLSGRKR